MNEKLLRCNITKYEPKVGQMISCLRDNEIVLNYANLSYEDKELEDQIKETILYLSKLGELK